MKMYSSDAFNVLRNGIKHIYFINIAYLGDHEQMAIYCMKSQR